MESLIDYLDMNAERAGGKVGWIFEGDRAVTYGEMGRLTNAFANGLRELGVQPGDRLSTFIQNSLEYVVACYGAPKAGTTVNPVNVLLKAEELRYILQDSAATAILTSPTYYPIVAQIQADLPDLRHVILTSRDEGSWVRFDDLLTGSSEPTGIPHAPNDNMFLAYSSGTTGHPKGIVHSRATATAQAVLSANRLGFRDSDIVTQSLPVFHLYGGNIIMGGILVAGGTLALNVRFDAENTLRSIERYRATVFAGVPTMFAYLTLLDESIPARYDLSTLQYATCAGAPLAGKIVSDFERMYRATIVNCYGITEAAGNLTAMMRYGDFPEGSAGIPYPYTTVRIVDGDDRDVPVGEVGEVIAAGPQIMKEYWGLPDATARALRGGYLHTGDLGRMDPQGHVFIVDRKNDMIITGGFNVYPAEVENMLVRHPKIGQVAVFGVEDQIRGELPCAAVVLRVGQTATEEEIISWSREQMATYKCPRRVFFVEDLPKSSVGKILRRELRDAYAGIAAGSTSAKG